MSCQNLCCSWCKWTASSRNDSNTCTAPSLSLVNTFVEKVTPLNKKNVYQIGFSGDFKSDKRFSPAKAGLKRNFLCKKYSNFFIKIYSNTCPHKQVATFWMYWLLILKWLQPFSNYSVFIYCDKFSSIIIFSKKIINTWLTELIFSKESWND